MIFVITFTWAHAFFFRPALTGCPAFSVRNGQVNFRSESFGDSSTIGLFYVSGNAEIQCDEGYLREPNNSILACQNDGTWSEIVPNCTGMNTQLLHQTFANKLGDALTMVTENVR